MAKIAPPSGTWKGLFVNAVKTIQVVLHLNFEGGVVTGQYELPDLDGPIDEGTLKGTYAEGGRLILEAVGEEKSIFEGKLLAGDEGKWMLEGTLSLGSGDLASLVAFHAPAKTVAFASAWD